MWRRWTRPHCGTQAKLPGYTNNAKKKKTSVVLLLVHELEDNTFIYRLAGQKSQMQGEFRIFHHKRAKKVKLNILFIHFPTACITSLFRHPEKQQKE
jgi:hypothetical protein